MADLFTGENATSYGNPDLVAADEALALRKAKLIAQMKAQTAGTGDFAPAEMPGESPGWTSAVTGTKIGGQTLKLSALAAARPLIAGLGNAIAQKGYDDDLSGFNRRQDEAARAHMAAMPAQDAPEADKLKWAQAGTAIPKLAPVMTDYFKDQVIKAPERAEARAERVQTRADQIAEAQRKQADELRYRRERDAQTDAQRRDIAQQHAETLLAIRAMHASNSAASAGDKASDYQIVQDPATGAVYRVGKKPGAPAEVVQGVTGNTGADVRKDANETRGQIERSSAAINNAPAVEKLLGQVSSSGLKSDIRASAGYFGYSDSATQAEKSLKPMADLYLKSVPRFEGPQSDKDTQSYKDAAADLANPRTSPEDRRAALQTVVKLHRQAIDQARARGNAPTSPRIAPTPSGPAKAPSSGISDDDLVRMYSK